MSKFLFPLQLQTQAIVVRHFYTRSVLCGTHYDVLNLQKNCSNKDIKDSFIKLSKKHHPDVNRNKDAHKKFLRINEAYKILSNPCSRHNYDQSLIPHRRVYSSDEPCIHHRQSYTDPWKDPSFYHNRDKSKDQAEPYYGIPGIPKLSNFTVSMICLATAAVIVVIQFQILRKVLKHRTIELHRRSQEAHRILHELETNAGRYSHKEQLELVKQRLDEHDR